MLVGKLLRCASSVEGFLFCEFAMILSTHSFLTVDLCSNGRTYLEVDSVSGCTCVSIKSSPSIAKLLGAVSSNRRSLFIVFLYTLTE